MTKLCPETGDPCYRMCLTMCHIISEDRVALRAEVERLTEAQDGAMRQDRDYLLAEVERLRAALQGLIVASDYYTDSAPYITALEAARAVLSPGAAHVDCPKCRTRLDPSDAVCFRCERPVDAMDGLARRKPSPKSEAAHK